MTDVFLHDDLLREVLVRLPIKSLLRFRCVSKSWYSFISSPKFITSHTHHSSKSNSYCVLLRSFNPAADKNVQYKLCQDNETLDDIMTIDFPFVSQHNVFFRMVGCVNGVVCLSDDIDEETDTLVLWNPVIGRFLTLPPPKIDNVASYMRQSIYGFGFDLLSNDYKVIRILYHKDQDTRVDERKVSTAIFRLSRGCWETNGRVSLPLLDNRQAYLNGVIHWLSFNNFIMGFDVGSEEFRKMTLPKLVQNAQVSSLTIAPWCGLLSIFEREYWSGSVSLWVMKIYGDEESWVKQFKIESKAIVRSLRRNGNVILENQSGKLVSYNHKGKKIEDCKIPIKGSVRGFHMKSYLESLVLLDQMDAQFVLQGSTNHH